MARMNGGPREPWISARTHTHTPPLVPFTSPPPLDIAKRNVGRDDIKATAGEKLMRWWRLVISYWLTSSPRPARWSHYKYRRCYFAIIKRCPRTARKKHGANQRVLRRHVLRCLRSCVNFLWGSPVVYTPSLIRNAKFRSVYEAVRTRFGHVIYDDLYYSLLNTLSDTVFFFFCLR